MRKKLSPPAGDLPRIYGDRTRLVEVMVNLLENAVKFMGDQVHPKIWIGSAEKDGQDVFYVRDNGIGIVRDSTRKYLTFSRKSIQNLMVPVSSCTGKEIIEVHRGKIGRVGGDWKRKFL